MVPPGAVVEPPVPGGTLAVVVPPGWDVPPVAVVVPPLTCPAAPVVPTGLVEPALELEPPVEESQPWSKGMAPARSKAAEPRVRACINFRVLVRIATSMMSSVSRILVDARPSSLASSARSKNDGSNSSDRQHDSSTTVPR